MLFRKSHRHGMIAPLDVPRRPGRALVGRASAVAPDLAHAARAFYRDVLLGRQVWDTEQSAAGGRLSFIVSGQRVDVSTTTPADDSPLILSVGNPQRLAERCWDAGFSVYVGDDATGATPVSVIDPFGRRIDLVP